MSCSFLGSALQLLKNFQPLNGYLLTVPIIKLQGPAFLVQTFLDVPKIQLVNRCLHGAVMAVRQGPALPGHSLCTLLFMPLLNYF